MEVASEERRDSVLIGAVVNDARPKPRGGHCDFAPVLACCGNWKKVNGVKQRVGVERREKRGCRVGSRYEVKDGGKNLWRQTVDRTTCIQQAAQRV